MKLLQVAFVIAVLAAPAHALEGRWITQSGNLEIEISPCGSALCGTAVKVLANHSMSHPGAEMQGVQGVGLKVLRDFVPVAENEWQGEIYNRENGKTYRCKMTLQSPDELSIHPYIGLPIFGKTQIWKRAADSGRDDGTSAGGQQ